MEKINFENLPSTNTPINAENLNQLQTNVEDAITNVEDAINDNTDMLIGNTPAGNMVVDSIRSKNIYNISNETKDKLINSSGNIIDNTAFNLSDYIEINSNAIYTFSWESSSSYFQVYVAYYDNNKSFISRQDLTDANTYSKSFTTLATAKYIRITYAKEVSGSPVSRTNIQIELGDTATQYFPFQQIVTEDTGWIDITLINGATQRSGNQYKPQCRRIGSVVYLKGQINIPGHSSNTSYFQLPAGYRPAYETKIIGPTTNNWIDNDGNFNVSTDNTDRNNQPIYTFFLIN